MILVKASIIIFNHNHSFIVLATVIMIVNYDRKTFIVQATILGVIISKVTISKVIISIVVVSR